MIVLEHNTRPAVGLAFAPTGSLLAVKHEYGVVLPWSLPEQRCLSGGLFLSGYGDPEFRFHPTRPQIYYAPEFNKVHWFDPTVPEADVLCQGVGWAEKLILTRDASRLLVCERGYCEFRLFDLTRGHDVAPTWTVPVYSRGTWGIRVSLDLLCEDRFVVVENHRNTRTRIAIRSLATGELLAANRIPNRTATALAMSPSGNCAVALSEMSLFIYATEKLKAAPRVVRNDNRKHFTGIAYHPSGKHLAATSNDATVKLYDATTWEIARTFTWDIGKMRSIAFSPDGTLAAAGSDQGKVVVWDVDV